MELLNLFHSIVVEQDQYRRSLPLADLVQIVRRVYDVDSNEKDRQEVFTMNGLSEEEIREICRQAELALKEKIAFTYFAHGKVNREQAEAMCNAFHDILTDWSEVGARDPSLFEYLQRYLPINEEVYEAELKAKMEYLLKVAREEVAARLMKEL